MRGEAYEQKRLPVEDKKVTKSTVVGNEQLKNGTKKVKSQQSNIRKSQPVFKSITGPRR